MIRFVHPRRLGAVLFFAAALAACSDKKDEYIERPVEELYNAAMDDLDHDEYYKAAKSFDEVDRQHPYSVWATKAQLMGAYALYERNKYDDALVGLERFIQLHPGNKDAPYAYYLRGLCYYEQITDVARDQKMTEQAMKSLQEVIDRFPTSRYARDARLKVDLARDHLAGKEMNIGRYYLRTGQFLAALNRFKSVVEQFQTTTHVPEALHRMIEIYTVLGLTDEAKHTAAVLGHNFPGSEWYQDSYGLVTTGHSPSVKNGPEAWYGWVPGLGKASADPAPAASPLPGSKKKDSGWFDWMW
jgi:outer membrane protein assembly factor BamD